MRVAGRREAGVFSRPRPQFRCWEGQACRRRRQTSRPILNKENPLRKQESVKKRNKLAVVVAANIMGTRHNARIHLSVAPKIVGTSVVEGAIVRRMVARQR